MEQRTRNKALKYSAPLANSCFVKEMFRSSNGEIITESIVADVTEFCRSFSNIIFLKCSPYQVLTVACLCLLCQFVGLCGFLRY